MNPVNSGDGGKPDSRDKDIKDLRAMVFILQAMLIRLSSEISAHRNAISLLGNKNDIRCEGKSLAIYIQDKIDQANNDTLAGLSDEFPDIATLLSNTLKSSGETPHGK